MSWKTNLFSFKLNEICVIDYNENFQPICTNDLNKLWFLLTFIPYLFIYSFSYLFIFGQSTGQTKYPRIPLAMLVSDSNMIAQLFGIIQVGVMVLVIFLGKKNNILTSWVQPCHGYKAKCSQIRNWLPVIWKGIGLDVELPVVKLILLHRPKYKQRNELPHPPGNKVDPEQYSTPSSQMLKSLETSLISPGHGGERARWLALRSPANSVDMLCWSEDAFILLLQSYSSR